MTLEERTEETNERLYSLYMRICDDKSMKQFESLLVHINAEMDSTESIMEH